MQIFVPFREPIKVARCLDKRRLNRQIQETMVILDAIEGRGKGWFNHPVTKMYKNHHAWLIEYLYCLDEYRNGDVISASHHSDKANAITPPFLTEEFCIQHRRRLYTKDPEFYKDFAEYGKSEENWYFVDGKIVKYKDGNRL